jgi:drug/metabolite transporter (DMT)-like permease
MSTAAQMLCGGVAMLVVGLALGERLHEIPSLRPTLAVGYLAAFGSIVGFSAYVWLLHHVRPALATSYAYVNPPIAVLLGALLLGEKVDGHVVGAMAVILAGVVIISRARTKV